MTRRVAGASALSLAAFAVTVAASTLSPLAVSAQTSAAPTAPSNPAGEGSSPLGPAPGTAAGQQTNGTNTATNAANNAVNSTPAPPANLPPPSTVPAVALPQNPTLNPSIPVPLATGRQGTSAPIAPATLPPSDAFNLAQTVDLALRSSSDLEIATTNLQRDAAAVEVARSQDLPRINTQDTYQHLDSPVNVPFAIPGQPTEFITAETQDKEILTLNGSLPLDISGRIRNTVRQAQLQQLADRFNRDRTYNNRVLYAQQTYFNLLRSQHQVDVDRSALQDAVTQETIAQRQFAGGVGQRVDFLRSQTQVATAQQNLFAAENDLSNQQNNFNDTIGRPLGNRVTVIDAAGVTTGTAVADNVAAAASTSPAAAAAAVQIPPASSFFSPDTTPPVSLEEGLRVAQKQRPELLADQVNIQAQERQVQIVRTNNYPTLSLNASGDYYPVTDFQTPRHSLGVYTVQLNIPIYDGGETAGQVREARANEQNDKTLYGSDQTEVELQVRQNYSNLETAAQQINAANTALQEAIAARELAQVRYANGISLYLEVTDAENALTQAETNQVNAVYNYLTARAQYENAIGAPQLGSTI